MGEMKHIIIGTAGHIDHGKTALIRALTGRNTDRWEEEQRRGITIDLGFTWFDLPDGTRAGIIDVPGHEKFVNNMTAGVVGMDLVLLVIAADDGIMPQTKEHIDILRLLGVEKCILVLNKCDLVDEDWLELVEEDIRGEMEGTFLADAPIVRVSAVTGAGLDDLVQTISRMVKDEVEEKNIDTIPRLPIDRAFSISGFGTIITGTLISGTIARDDTLELYPTGQTCRVRSIQVHGEDCGRCQAGQRVALNLSSVKKQDVYRGCVLAPPGSMRDTDLLDVRLDILESSNRIVTNHARLHFFTGTSEVLCRAVLLDAQEIGPGESGYVQLRLEKKVAVRRGDRFVVRFYSPMETIGGGVILEPNPRVKKRFRENVIEELRQKESGTTADVLEFHIRDHAAQMVTVTELARLTGVSKEETEADVTLLEQEGRICTFQVRNERYAWHQDSMRAKLAELTAALTEYETKYPYRFGMRKADVLMTHFRGMAPGAFDKVIEKYEAEGYLKRADEYLCTPEFSVRKDARYERVSGTLLDVFRQAEYNFVRYTDVDVADVSPQDLEDIVNVLRIEGSIVSLEEGVYTLTEYMERGKKRIADFLAENPVITIVQVGELFGSSRKNTKLILEYMDRVRVTKKTAAVTERIAYQ